jgi:transcriptional regulator with XRE-family HTH domain
MTEPDFLATDDPKTTGARTRAVVRAQIEAVLADVSRRRSAAKIEEAAQLDRVAALLEPARAAGLSLERIASLSGVSRPTLTTLREPERVGWADAEFALLLALAVGGPQDDEQLLGHAAHFAHDRELGAALEVLLSRGLVGTRFVTHYQAANAVRYLGLTRSGEDALLARLPRAGMSADFAWTAYFAIDESEGRKLEAAGETLLGTHEVTLLYPGQGQNTDWEIAFQVLAATRADAFAEGHRQLTGLRKAAGIDVNHAAGNVVLFGPTS